MIRVVTKRKEIRDCQRALEAAIAATASDTREMTVSFRPETHTGPGHWFSATDFWVVSDTTSTRWWTALGLGYPFDETQEITVEVNVPHKGIDRRVGGAFGVDDTGRRYLLHRGGLVHLKGFRKEAFLDFYGRDFLVEVDDGDRVSDLIVVGDIDGALLPVELRDFAAIASAFKEELRETGVSPRARPEGLPGVEMDRFDPESEDDGWRSPLPGRVVRRQHGLVVNALATVLADRGFGVANDRSRDLFIPNGREGCEVLFEVKTSSDTQSVFTAVGQLMVLGHRHGADRRVAVLPAGSPARVHRELQGLNIGVLEWSMKSGGIAFSGLERVL